LRLKQRENNIIDSIADILVEFFSALSSQRLKSAYGEFCSLFTNKICFDIWLVNLFDSVVAFPFGEKVGVSITVKMEAIFCKSFLLLLFSLIF
jgi:hypothetical protein